MPFTRQLGQLGDKAQQAAGAIASVAPFTGPAAPFVALAAALVNVGDSIAHLFSKYDPQKRHDTAVVEAFESAFHTILYQLTGEALPGIPGVTATTTPGNYGDAGINLFQASSYPNVPYPTGAPGTDASAAIASLTATFQNFNGQLERPASIPNLANNYQYALGVLQQIATAQTQAGGPSTITGGSFNLPVWGWAAAGVAAIAIVRRTIAHVCTKQHMGGIAWAL